MRAHALAILFGLASCASPREAQIVQRGDTLVEVIGLRDWTVSGIEVELARFAPHLSIASAACAVILRDSIGFDQAAVTTYPATDAHRTWVVISVVEPGRGTWTRAPAFNGPELSTPDSWAGLAAALEGDRGAMSYLQDPAFLLGESNQAWGSEVPSSGLRVRRALRDLASDEEWDRARDLIVHGDLKGRTLAALVLSNFPERDETWYDLVGLVTRRADSAGSMAGLLVRVLSRTDRFSVDWSGGADRLDQALRGSNLFALPSLLDALVRTKADPKLLRELLGRDPEPVLAYLRGKDPFLPPTAHRFLVYMADGQDLGTDPSAWRDWLAKRTA